MSPCRLVVRFLVIPILSALCGCHSLSPSPATKTEEFASPSDNQALKEALASYADGILRLHLDDKDAAVYDFERVIEVLPENLLAPMQLAGLYLELNQPEKTREILENMLESHPAPDICFVGAQIAQALKDLDLAETFYKKAIALDSVSFETHLRLALFYLLIQNNKEAAFATLENAVAIVDRPEKILWAIGDWHTSNYELLLAENELKAAEFLRLAIQAYQATEALPLKEDPEWFANRKKLGLLYLDSERYAEGIQLFQQLLERDPSNHDYQGLLILSCVKAGAESKALEYIEKFSQTTPANTDLFYTMALFYEEQGKAEAAIKILRQALSVKPRKAQLYLKLAELTFDKDPESAEKTLREGVSLFSENMELTEALAGFYQKTQNWKDAAQTLAILFHLYKTQAPEKITHVFLFDCATAAQQAGQHDAALTLYQAALNLYPKSFLIYARLIFLQLALKNEEQVQELLKKTLEITPDDITPAVASYMSIVYMKFEKHDAAYNLLQKVEKIEGENITDANYYFYYGMAAFYIKRLDHAAFLLQKALALDPEHADAANSLAYMWAENNVNLTEAEVLVQHALELDPENSAYIDTLGWVYFKQGRLAEAEDEIYNSLQIMPDDNTVQGHYVEILKQRHGPEAAQAWQEENIKTPPPSALTE